MTTEFEDVTWTCNRGELEDRLNEIRTMSNWTNGEWTAPYKATERETLANSDSTYTIIFSKRSDEWIEAQVAEYERMLVVVTEKVEQDNEAYEKHLKARNQWPIDEQKRIDNEWNSRSIWYQLFHKKPGVGYNPHDSYSLSYEWRGTDYALDVMERFRAKVGITPHRGPRKEN